MLPTAFYVWSTIVYLAFLCVLGILTGLLIALVSWRRPTGRDVVLDFVLAGTAAVASATLLTVYHRARDIPESDAPSLIPVAVGSVVLRHVVAMLRRAT
jgi:hypothetical protein